MQALLGKKLAQTQAFLIDGTRIPVTVVSVPDAPVVAVKTIEKDGYAAVQIGYGSRKKATKPLLGHSKKANLTVAPKVLREVRIAQASTPPTVGDTIKIEDVFQPGDIVKVTGFSKGKGFAGVVKRHNFRGGPRTHGQSDRERAPGSIGQTTTPGRVYKGKRMAGRMGNEQVSVTNLVVIDIVVKDGEKTVLVKGLIPGGVNTVVTLEKTGKMSEKKFVPLQKLEEPKVDEGVDSLETQTSEISEDQAVAMTDNQQAPQEDQKTAVTATPSNDPEAETVEKPKEEEDRKE